MRPLVIPPAAQRDDGSIQMLSAWIAEKGVHCTLNVGMWHAQGRPEASAWGILLADVVRHLAGAIREDRGVDPEATAREVVRALIAELESPTSSAHGRFHVGNS